MSEETPIVNADQAHAEVSKGIFKEAMAAVANDAAARIDPPEAVPEKKAVDPEKKEGSDAKTSIIPDELLGGEPVKKEESEQDEGVAALEAMTLPKNAKPEQVASFAKLKEQSKKLIEERDARFAELQSRAANTTNKAELDALSEKYKASEARAVELEAALERVSFENSPRFKAQFVASEKSAIEGAKTYLEGTEINPDVVELASRATGQKRLQILRDAGADAELIAAISPHLAQFDAIQRGKAEALENWKAAATQWEQGQKTQQEQQAAARKADEDKVFDTVIATAQSELIPFRKVEGHAEWNAQVDSLSAEARRIFNGDAGGLDVVAKTVAAGVAMPVLQKMFNGVIEQLKTLKAENAKLKSAKPAGGTSTNVSTNGHLSPEEEAKMRFRRNMELATSQ